jgi:hypothetical protein
MRTKHDRNKLIKTKTIHEFTDSPVPHEAEHGVYGELEIIVNKDFIEQSSLNK